MIISEIQLNKKNSNNINATLQMLKICLEVNIVTFNLTRLFIGLET